MTDKIRKLPLDYNKRHFIIGDIHGRYETMLELLISADYDPSTDIVYTVGDMIDRGPKSFEVLKFFTHEPNNHAILGNHEYMAVTPMYTQTWLCNGGGNTIASLEENKKDIHWLRDQVEYLPWVLEVGDRNDDKAFRIVHADYEPHLSDTAAFNFLSKATNEDGYFNGENIDLQGFIWSRQTIYEGKRNVDKMKPIHHGMDFNPNRKRHNYVGHTPINKILTIGDITFLDTFDNGTLSMIEVLSGETYTTKVID
jgi:serine/threonine protein phosphatase 1